MRKHMSFRIKNFNEARDFIFWRLFEKKIKSACVRKKQLSTREEHLNELKLFLKKLDNPQNKLCVINIVGTSGKGSTAYLLSILLRAHGFKVGLSLSPHVRDIRERLQINNHYLSKKKLVQYLNEICSIFAKKELQNFSSNQRKKVLLKNLSYFQILSIMSWWSFYQEKVDYVIFESGKGGRDDLSHVVTTQKCVVITRIGKDHTNVLGKTMTRIAKNKSGIIGKNDKVIACWTNRSISKIFQAEIEKNHAEIHYVQENKEYKNVQLSHEKTLFDFFYKDQEKNIFFNFPQLQLGLIGYHQAENAALALTAFVVLSRRDRFYLYETKIRKSLRSAYLPARFEIRRWKNKILILDGAHNKQKIQALLETLKILFPDKKYAFLLPWSHAHAQKEKVFLSLILPFAKKVILTQPSLFLEENFFLRGSQKIKFISHPKNAFNELFCQKEKILVITGSFYLLAELYPFLPKGKSV